MRGHFVTRRALNYFPPDNYTYHGCSLAILGLGAQRTGWASDPVKTIYVLRYIQDEELRRQVGKQLNRGEHRQAVARHVFFADQGEFRTADLAQIMNKASCLSLLSNAILAWNTVHISNIVNDLRENGHTVTDEHLAGISPMLQKHVIVNGMYDFTQWTHKPMQVQ